MTNDKNNGYKLTEHAHGAGCGCKIAPQVLSEILAGNKPLINDSRLLVGSESNDDAAVYDLGNGKALICTTDFFMPIVDDAFEFGRIAAANAISDVYAMGGTPIVALAILGWPINKLPVQLAQQVVQGAREMCAKAGIVLAGGHSIDTLEPVFGLSVNGEVELRHLKKNNTAKEGDLVYLTKPLGSGILSTARKRKLLTEEDAGTLLKHLSLLNSMGAELGEIEGVSAMTDVTGFGLLGHLHEMAKGSGLSADLWYNKVPLMNNLQHYIAQSVLPDATFRNWNAYNADIFMHSEVNSSEAFMTLPDPQTNGGLLFTVAEKDQQLISELFSKHGLAGHAGPIGRITARKEKIINILLN